MNEPKFTPGPWKYGTMNYPATSNEKVLTELPLDYTPPWDGDEPIVWSVDGTPIISGVGEWVGLCVEAEDLALILAAPDMYEALSNLVNKIPDDKVKLHDFIMATNALRKARGEKNDRA